MKKNPTHIVFLGGGYLCVYAYRTLAKKLNKKLTSGEIQLTVVCPIEHHVFHGWTAESLTGIIESKNQESLLVEIMPKARLLLGKANEIDTGNKVVYLTMNDGSQNVLPYHHLLLGIGAFDITDIPGLKEHGYQVKCRASFQKTKLRLQELVEMASKESPAMAQQLLRFSIVGSGFTGVEMVTNIAEFIRIIQKQHPSLEGITPQIRLINSTDRVLSSLIGKFNSLVRYTEKQLEQYGIEVVKNSRMKEVTAQGLLLQDGSFVPSSMVISAIGQSRIILDGTEHFQRDALQRLYTNDYLQIANEPTIWGGGDACHVKHPFTGNTCPSNALWAIKQGAHLGGNIARAVDGKPLKKFRYIGLGQSASLGLGKGITELYGIPLTGGFAWITRLFFFLYFMPSSRIRMACASNWLHLLFKRERKGLMEVSENDNTEKYKQVSIDFGLLKPASLYHQNSQKTKKNQSITI